MKPKFNQTTHMIEDLATLQVIAEPLRAQIFEVLANDMLTVRQVSERLGLTPSRLYYHINLLEQHGLIQVVETRTVMNMIEKVYQAVAPNLEVADALGPQLWGVRLDTSNTMVDRSLWHEMGRFRPTGVVPELVWKVRRALDDLEGARRATAELAETACALTTEVAAVAVWPSPRLAPGELAEIYVVRRLLPPAERTQPRPSLIGWAP